MTQHHRITIDPSIVEPFALSGRPRYLVRCWTCQVVVHEATTGPAFMADAHLRGERGYGRPMTEAERGVRWRWATRPDGSLFLLTPTDQHAATVYPNGTWFVWDADGDGGQNDVADSVEMAKWSALCAAKVAWYESGDVSPIGCAP